MFIRFLLFSLLMLVLFVNLWAFFVLGFIYALRYTAYELVALALCIDAYFGGQVVPYYLIVTIVSLCIVEWVKPSILRYTN